MRKLSRKVVPIICSDVERTNWLIDHGGSVVEVVLDSGTVGAGDEESSVNELELELRTGESAALFDFARELGREVPLQVGVLSKAERGHMLAEGAFGHEQRASEVGIRKSMDVGQAFMLIVQECVRHFRLNEPLIVAERDPRALHQARVAMRRLRTSFSLFRPAIRQGSAEPLTKELKELIAPFGTARNLDVFLDRHGDELGWRQRRKLIAARDDSYDQVIAMLESSRCRDTILDLVEWTSSEAWRKDAASMPIGKFAADRLNTSWKRVKRRGTKLGDLEQKQLHRLRIGIKKLRYAVEFFAPLYAKKRVRRFSSSLEAMQDCLGLIHDDMIAQQIVADYALGEVGRPDAAARSRQLQAMDKRFTKLKRDVRFWKD